MNQPVAVLQDIPMQTRRWLEAVPFIPVGISEAVLTTWSKEPQQHLPNILACGKIDWHRNVGVDYAPFQIPVVSDPAPVELAIQHFTQLLIPLRQCSEGQESFTTMLSQLAAVFPVQDIGAQGVKLRAMAFMDVFADLPVEAFRRAAQQYIRDGRFFPMPSELLERAEPHVQAWQSRLSRAQKLLGVYCDATGDQSAMLQ